MLQEQPQVSAASVESFDPPLHADFGIESEQPGQDDHVFEDPNGVGAWPWLWLQGLVLAQDRDCCYLAVAHLRLYAKCDCPRRADCRDVPSQVRLQTAALEFPGLAGHLQVGGEVVEASADCPWHQRRPRGIPLEALEVWSWSRRFSMRDTYPRQLGGFAWSEDSNKRRYRWKSPSCEIPRCDTEQRANPESIYPHAIHLAVWQPERLPRR